MKDAIHLFKYERHARLGKRLASFLAETFFASPDFRSTEVLIPVPLHRKRRRERGYNQSEILARELSRRVGILVITSALYRVKETQVQTGLSRRRRRLNVASAFNVLDSREIQNKICLVIDDVFTTGATLNECARTLRRAGAREVFALTCARVAGEFF